VKQNSKEEMLGILILKCQNEDVEGTTTEQKCKLKQYLRTEKYRKLFIQN
jgi:hypothetical protein